MDILVSSKDTTVKDGLLGFVQCNTMRLSLNRYLLRPWVSRLFLSIRRRAQRSFPRRIGYFISGICGCIPTTKRWVRSLFRSITTPTLSRRKQQLQTKLLWQLVLFMPIETCSSITGGVRGDNQYLMPHILLGSLIISLPL